MSDTKFFRQYLDILNEGPPPGIGPNASRPPIPTQPAKPGQDLGTQIVNKGGQMVIDKMKGIGPDFRQMHQELTPGSEYYQKNIANNPALVKRAAEITSQMTPDQFDANVSDVQQRFTQAIDPNRDLGRNATSPEYEKAADQLGLPQVQEDDMDEGKLMRKYIDFLDEAPATAINPNDKNAAAFGKQINSPQAAPTVPANKYANITQQVAKASNVVDPNAPKGAGYDPSKVQYAYSGGQPTNQQPVNNQSSGYTAQSQAQKSAPTASSPTFTGMAGNTQSNPTFTGMAGATKGASAQPAAEPSLASQYVTANQPKPVQASTPPTAPTATSEPSLASQYVQANQPQAVAEEENDSDDELLKSIIRLIKK